MNDKLEGISKEAVVVYFKVRRYPGICFEGLKEPMKTYQDIRCLAASEYEAGV
jgi:hypothetical protein